MPWNICLERVYEEKGELFAGVCGTVKEDNENMKISIIPSVSVPLEIFDGDVVFGKIQSVRDSMVSVEIVKVKEMTDQLEDIQWMLTYCKNVKGICSHKTNISS